MQHFFDLYSPSHPLNIRTSAAKDNYYTIPISERVILEYTLSNPRHQTVSADNPDGTVYSTRSDETMPHAVWEFATPGPETHVLDLASMQFGEPGRGDGELFRLGSMEFFYDGIEKVVVGCDLIKQSLRIGPAPNDARLQEVAKRVQTRLEGQATAPWCDYCGKGQPPKKCACLEVFYCGPDHSAAGWGFHKRWCKAKGKGRQKPVVVS